jgi:hypothetical protein
VAISIRLAEILRTTGELALARGILHEAESWGDQGSRLQALLVRALGQLVAAERDRRGRACRTCSARSAPRSPPATAR